MAITVGVIGCGSISRFHFSGLAKAGARIKWVCDLSEKTARPWADQFKAAYTPDYRAILKDLEVQAVVVTPVSSVHKAICLDAIRAGKAVICEKTLAENADDALEIVREAESRKTIFYTSYMKRFIPAVEEARALMPSLGRILSTHIRAYQAWGDLWTAAPQEGFFHSPPGGKSAVVKNYGGGILVCGGSHILDLVNCFLGRPRRLYAAMHTTPGCDFDVQAVALLETDNGPVQYEALAHGLTRIGFLRDGWDEHVEITGLNGRLDIYSASWNEVESNASLLVHYDNAAGTSTEYRYGPASPFDRADAFFCRNIEQGVQGEQSRLTGYEVDELIAHIKRSAATGKAIEVNWKIS